MNDHKKCVTCKQSGVSSNFSRDNQKHRQGQFQGGRPDLWKVRLVDDVCSTQFRALEQKHRKMQQILLWLKPASNKCRSDSLEQMNLRSRMSQRVTLKWQKAKTEAQLNFSVPYENIMLVLVLQPYINLH